MISNRPYLLDAFYRWIVDSQCTPIVVIDATHSRCKIPQDYVEEGEIVFNISPTAIRDLNISNDFIEFKASFSGVICFISAPINAVLAIYAEENGEGIFFDPEEEEGVQRVIPLQGLDHAEQSLDLERQVSTHSNEKTKKKPILTLVD
jgi:stringent starvation protein B